MGWPISKRISLGFTAQRGPASKELKNSQMGSAQRKKSAARWGMSWRAGKQRTQREKQRTYAIQGRAEEKRRGLSNGRINFQEVRWCAAGSVPRPGGSKSIDKGVGLCGRQRPAAGRPAPGRRRVLGLLLRKRRALHPAQQHLLDEDAADFVPILLLVGLQVPPPQLALAAPAAHLRAGGRGSAQGESSRHRMGGLAHTRLGQLHPRRRACSARC